MLCFCSVAILLRSLPSAVANVIHCSSLTTPPCSCVWGIYEFSFLDRTIEQLTSEAKDFATEVFLPQNSWKEITELLEEDKGAFERNNSFDHGCTSLTERTGLSQVKDAFEAGGGAFGDATVTVKATIFLPNSTSVKEPIGPFSLVISPTVDADLQRIMFISALFVDAVAFGLFGLFLSIVTFGCCDCSGDPCFEYFTMLADLILWAGSIALLVGVIVVAAIPLPVSFQVCLTVYDIDNQYGYSSNGTVQTYSVPMLLRTEKLATEVVNDPFELKTWDDKDPNLVTEYTYLNFDFKKSMCVEYDHETYISAQGLYDMFSSRGEFVEWWRVCDTEIELNKGRGGCLCDERLKASNGYCDQGFTCEGEIEPNVENAKAYCTLNYHIELHQGSPWICAVPGTLGSQTESLAFPGCPCASDNGTYACSSANTFNDIYDTDLKLKCQSNQAVCDLTCSANDDAGACRVSDFDNCEPGERGCECTADGTCENIATYCHPDGFCALTTCTHTAQCADRALNETLVCLAGTVNPNSTRLEELKVPQAGRSGVCALPTPCAANTTCPYGQVNYTCNGFLPAADAEQIDKLVAVIRDEVNQGLYFNLPVSVIDTIVIFVQYILLRYVYIPPDVDERERQDMLRAVVKQLTPRSKKQLRRTGRIPFEKLKKNSKAYRLAKRYEKRRSTTIEKQSGTNTLAPNDKVATLFAPSVADAERPLGNSARRAKTVNPRAYPQQGNGRSANNQRPVSPRHRAGHISPRQHRMHHPGMPQQRSRRQSQSEDHRPPPLPPDNGRDYYSQQQPPLPPQQDSFGYNEPLPDPYEQQRRQQQYYQQQQRQQQQQQRRPPLPSDPGDARGSYQRPNISAPTAASAQAYRTVQPSQQSRGGYPQAAQAYRTMQQQPQQQQNSRGYIPPLPAQDPGDNRGYGAPPALNAPQFQQDDGRSMARSYSTRY